MGTRDPFHLQNVQTQALESFNLLFSGYRDPIPEINRPEFEVDHSSYSNAEAKNEWSCDFTPLVRLLEADRENFIKTVSEYPRHVRTLCSAQLSEILMVFGII